LDLDNKLFEIGFEKLAVRPAIIVSGTYLKIEEAPRSNGTQKTRGYFWVFTRRA